MDQTSDSEMHNHWQWPPGEQALRMGNQGPQRAAKETFVNTLVLILNMFDFVASCLEPFLVCEV